MRSFFLGLSFFLSMVSVQAEVELQGYVSVDLTGQLGNQMFEIAAGYAYALDHQLELRIPDLIQKKKDNVSVNGQRLFLSKISAEEIPVPCMKWKEPSFNYHAIPDSQAIELKGFFQSEKYFKHRKNEILDLFSPPEGTYELILSKYPFLASDALIVGVQMRDYRVDKMYGKNHPTIGRAYYETAMAQFPKDTIFFVSSNNLEYAKELLAGLPYHIVYEEAFGKDYINAFYTLTLCKSFIISNSTFGWWAAWLCSYPEKEVIVPSPWFAPPFNNEEMTRDLFPEDWKVLVIQKKKKLK